MSNIEFWLTFSNGAERLRLPVNPASIEISTPFSHSDVEVARLGEYAVIGERGLADISFSSFLPKLYNESYCEYSGFPEPWEIIKTIEKWRDSRRPMRLTVAGTPINYAVTVREFTYDPERAGNPGDIYYTLSFKEYRFVTARENVITQKKPKVKTASMRPPAPKPKPKKTYTVKRGDSLWAIAKRHYGNGNDWRKIYNNAKNKKLIGKNPNLIHPGQKLIIP